MTQDHASDRLVWGLTLTLLVAELALSIWRYNPAGDSLVRAIGWVVWGLGAVLGWLPIFTLRRSGAVAKGASYVHTTHLVTTGIYAVVRHPQYLSFGLIAVALILIVQDWVVAGVGTLAAVGSYLIACGADRACLAKFGEPYRRYMERVPRSNLVLGLLRLARRKGGRARS
jgi:protein-S-isoprenylcysteine O-methyltransferase Ste14